jgi:hypothetical protein
MESLNTNLTQDTQKKEWAKPELQILSGNIESGGNVGPHENTVASPSMYAS